MGMTIGQLGSPLPYAAGVAAAGPADTDAAAQFSARMGAGGKQATDAQIACVPRGDMERLRQKWGADEAGLREEAYGLWEFGEKFGDAIMMQTFRDLTKHTQELVEIIRG